MSQRKKTTDPRIVAHLDAIAKAQDKSERAWRRMVRALHQLEKLRREIRRRGQQIARIEEEKELAAAQT